MFSERSQNKKEMFLFFVALLLCLVNAADFYMTTQIHSSQITDMNAAATAISGGMFEFF